jgi:hypothetical protein
MYTLKLSRRRRKNDLLRSLKGLKIHADTTTGGVGNNVGNLRCYGHVTCRVSALETVETH